MSYDPYFEKMSDTFEDITVLPLETSIWVLKDVYET